MIKCIFSWCDKTWPKFDRANVIIHHRDDHQGNLIFLSDDDVRAMVKEVDEN